MADQSTLRLFVEHLTLMFEPLQDAAASLDAFRQFFVRLGHRPDIVPDQYVTVAGLIGSAITAIENVADDPSPDDIITLFGSIEGIYNGLKAAPVPDGITAADATALAKDVFDLLLADYLARVFPAAYRTLVAIGVITLEYSESTDSRLEYVTTTIHYDKIGDVLSDPTQWPSLIYGWGTPGFDFADAAGTLAEFLMTAGIPIELGSVDRLTSQAYQKAVTSSNGGPTVVLRAIAVDTVIDDIPLRAGLLLMDLPAEDANLPGFIIQPDVPTSIDTSFAVTDDITLNLSAGITPATPWGLVVRPKQPLELRFPGTSSTTEPTVTIGAEVTTQTPLVILGRPSASRLEAAGVKLQVKSVSTGGNRDIVVSLAPSGLNLILSAAEFDGFVGKLIPGNEFKVSPALELQWSTDRGLRFTGSAAFKIETQTHIDLGPIALDRLTIEVRAGTGGPAALVVQLAADVSATLGPVFASLEQIGFGLSLTFQDGNAGRFDVKAAFKPPTGVGISIEAGPVSGGGFISFDEPNGRYFGALELSVYSIAVKAFGLIETKFPDGHKGFSFLIIISAEFTPIQLGFGFTLTGVGGLAGINRTIDSDALLATVRKGTLDNLLFPQDVVKNATSIAHDVGAIFPAASGHYVFGPLAKLGWGTPTLIEAKIGLIIEFPGPRLVLLGTVHCALPKPDAALVLLNLDVAGVLDFPKKSFSLDASLHDSRVGEFPVSGEMAMRLTWGNNPNFALAIGGFNPNFTPPAGFPKLRPASIDLGTHDNPSINLAGYMALTSNTAQTGAKLEARVSKSGASLYGFISFDAIFVFSPFSFMADIEGGVDVSFHGAGFGLHFHGHIQGPSPWKLDGQVCVSILFWDACVGFSVTLGGDQKVSLPGLDPWVGSPATERSLAKQDVQGLSQALETVANWSGNLPPAGVSVVTLVAAPEGQPTPVDPLGSATFRQKAVPLTIPITKFAGTKPSKAREFHVQSATIGQANQGATTTVTTLPLVKDYFAPAQYIDMKDADKLSHPSFDLLDAGFSVSSNQVVPGASVTKPFKYDTVMFDANGPQPAVPQQYDPTNTHVASVTGRSAVALAGVRQSGLARFIDLPFFSKATLVDDKYGIADIGTLGGVTGFPSGVSRSAAFAALKGAAALNPNLRNTIQISPTFNLRAA